MKLNGKLTMSREESLTPALIFIYVNLVTYTAFHTVSSLGLSLESVIMTVFAPLLIPVMGISQPVYLLPFVPIVLFIPLGYIFLRRTWTLRIVVALTGFLFQILFFLLILNVEGTVLDISVFSQYWFWLMTYGVSVLIGWAVAELCFVYQSLRAHKNVEAAID